MKILLVEPDDSIIPGLNFGGLWRLEPISLEVIAGSVPEHEVMIVDLRLDCRPIEDYLEEFNPSIVGVTGVTALHSQMQHIVTKAKQAGAFTVAGGPHASFTYERFINLDAAVIGEGEGTFRNLVEVLENGNNLYEVPNLAWYNGDKGWAKNKQEQSDLWCLPRRCLAQSYKYQAFGVQMGAVEATRGCPHRCTFCVTPNLFRGRYRMRDPREVASIIAQTTEPFIFFVDPDFMVSREYVASVLYSLKEQGVKKRYWANLRVDEVCKNEDLIQLWSSIGFSFALLGIEGYTNEQLTKLQKDTNLDQNKMAVKILRSYSVISIGTFITDPSWDKQEFNEACTYLRDLQVDIRFLSILTPFPGSKLEKEYEIIKDYDKWDVLHAVIPTKLPWHEFQRQFALASKRVLNLREKIRLIFKLWRIGLFSLNTLASIVRVVLYMNQYHKSIEQ